MMWFFAILVVLAMGGVAALAAGRGAPMSQAYDDRPDALVPRSGPLRADDVRRVRFPLAFRGYRMTEVDALLDRVARQLDEAEQSPAVEPVTAVEPEQEPPWRDAGWTAPESTRKNEAAGQDEVVDTPGPREVRGDDPLT